MYHFASKRTKRNKHWWADIQKAIAQRKNSKGEAMTDADCKEMWEEMVNIASKEVPHATEQSQNFVAEECLWNLLISSHPSSGGKKAFYPMNPINKEFESLAKLSDDLAKNNREKAAEIEELQTQMKEQSAKSAIEIDRLHIETHTLRAENSKLQEGHNVATSLHALAAETQAQAALTKAVATLLHEEVAKVSAVSRIHGLQSAAWGYKNLYDDAMDTNALLDEALQETTQRAEDLQKSSNAHKQSSDDWQKYAETMEDHIMIQDSGNYAKSCHNCQLMGHLEAECTAPCLRCRRFGHTKLSCKSAVTPISTRKGLIGKKLKPKVKDVHHKVASGRVGKSP